MIYARLLLISIVVFIVLSTTTVIILSQSSTRQVGVPICEIYPNSGSPGRYCASIRCSTLDYAGLPPNNEPFPSCSPTHPDSQREIHCESQGTSNCTVSEQISCNSDNKGAAYGRSCTLSGGVLKFITIQSPKITCPVTCPGCPTPDPNKPCRRAVWSTTYCRWDRSPCDTAGVAPIPGGCGELPDSTGCASGFTLDPEGFCNRSFQFQSRCAGSGYDEDSCLCPDGMSNSPIIIDVDGSGFSLTNAANGVDFDIQNFGYPQHLSWTANNSTNAFLVLDRNGNGAIDNGEELFGNVTPQPQSANPNGFIALAEYDKITNGGNNDGVITALDTVFNNLRLWQDTNHNGVSESSELKALPLLGLAKIELDYKESKRTDEFGNQFKYRSKVKNAQGAQLGRWAWDVFLVEQP